MTEACRTKDHHDDLMLLTDSIKQPEQCHLFKDHQRICKPHSCIISACKPITSCTCTATTCTRSPSQLTCRKVLRLHARIIQTNGVHEYFWSKWHLGGLPSSGLRLIPIEHDCFEFIGVSSPNAQAIVVRQSLQSDVVAAYSVPQRQWQHFLITEHAKPALHCVHKSMHDRISAGQPVSSRKQIFWQWATTIDMLSS